MFRVLNILLILVLLIIPFELEQMGRTARAWWNFMHVPAFAILAFWAIRSVDRFGVETKRLVFAGLLFLLVPGIELMQHVTGREASFADVLYGWVGCFAGFALSNRCVSSLTMRLALRFLAVVFIMLAAVFPVRIMMDSIRIKKAFPELAAFEDDSDLLRWEMTGCSAEAEKSDVIIIEKNVGYPGMFLNDMVSDWSDAQILCIDLFWPGEKNLAMWVRVDDLPDSPTYYERFQKVVWLVPGSNLVKIARSEFNRASGGRSLNLKDIETMGLFFEPDSSERKIIFRRIYLELGEL